MHCNRVEINIDLKPIILFEQSHTTNKEKDKMGIEQLLSPNWDWRNTKDG